MNVALTPGYVAPIKLNYQTRLSEATHQRANQRIAQSLRCDASFMMELKRLGVYDEDARDVIEDETEVDG